MFQLFETSGCNGMALRGTSSRSKTGKHGQFLVTIEYLKTQKNGLIETMGRKNRTKKGASKETQNMMGKEVLDLKEKLADMEGELRS